MTSTELTPSSIDMKIENGELSMFKLKRKIGRGAFGIVYKAQVKQSGRIVALKQMKISSLEDKDMLEQAKKECRIHYALSHSNILTLLGFFHDKKYIYLICEFADNGDLRNLISKMHSGKLEEAIAARFLRQLACALHYCHSKSVIHRDIKQENLLLDKHLNLKLCDFGLSVATDVKRTTQVGTPIYLAPELVAGEPYDHAVDAWATGVLLFEMLVGRSPFKSFEEIENVSYQIPPEVNHGPTNLISALLKKQPQHRLLMIHVIEHMWMEMMHKVEDVEWNKFYKSLSKSKKSYERR